MNEFLHVYLPAIVFFLYIGAALFHAGAIWVVMNDFRGPRDFIDYIILTIVALMWPATYFLKTPDVHQQ